MPNFRFFDEHLAHILSRIKHMIVCVCVLAVHSSMAQSFEYRLKNFTGADGLPSSQIYQIIQDSKGYIWFGTDRGLVQFNGESFKTYTSNDGLASNVFFYVDEAPDGSIWCWGKDRSLSFVKDGEAHQFAYNDSLSKLVRVHADVMSFDVNETGIHVYSFMRLVEEPFYVHFDYNDVYHYHSELENDLRIYEDKEKVHIMMRLDPDNDLESDFNIDVTHFGHLTTRTDSFRAPFVMNNIERVSKIDDRLFFSLFSTLYEWTDKVEVVHSFKNRIIELESTKEGHLMIGTSKNLWEMDPNYPFQKEVVLNEASSSFLEDKHGGYWIGTLYKGLFYVAPHQSKILKGNPGETFINIEGDDNDILYSSSTNHVYSLNDSDFDRLSMFNESTFIRLFQKIDSNLVVLTPRFGVKMNMSSHEIDYFLRKSVYSVEKIVSFERDYFGINKGAVHAYGSDLSAPKVNILRSLDFNIYDIDTNYNGYYMLATPEGMKKFDLKEITDHDFKNSYFNSSIRDIERVDADNVIYASESKGILISSDGSSYNIDQSKGLLSNNIRQVKYIQGKIVAQSSGGVSILENRAGMAVINNYSASNAFAASDVSDVFYRNDTIWITSTQGLEQLSLEQRADTNVSVFVSDIKVNGAHQDNLGELNLDYDQNQLEINLDILSFAQYDNINLRYRLKGLELHWTNSSDRTVIYQQVPPGDYEFQIQYKDLSGKWSKTYDLIEIHITKPHWRTTAFLIAMVFFIVGFITAIIFVVVRMVKRREKRKLELVDLERRALQSQMNPHFVFNSLTSLQSLIMNEQIDESVKYLVNFSKLTRLALDHSTKMFVPLNNELDLIKRYVELERLRFAQDFEFTIENNLRDFDRQIPPTVIQPFVENAILHGLLSKKGPKKLRLLLNEGEHGDVECVIDDNGVGRSAVKKSRHSGESMGIRLIEDRLNLISLHKGQRVIITDKIENGSPTGTTVTIKIPTKKNENFNH